MEIGKLTTKKAVIFILIYLAFVVVINAQDWGQSGGVGGGGVGGGDEITGGTCTNQAVTAIDVDTAIPTCTTMTDAYVANNITIDLATVATTANAGDSATAFFSAGTIEDARIDGSAEVDEITLAGDVDGVGNSNDLDEAAVETEIESVVDLQDLQGAVTDAQVPNNILIGGQKSFTILAPTSAENTGIIKIGFAVTITQVDSVCVGSSPSVTWNIKHHTDRSNAGTDTFTANQVTTSTTTGDVDNSGFNDATVAAGEHIWFITSAVGGTITECTFTVTYTAD